jgi:hypothetical protein
MARFVSNPFQVLGVSDPSPELVHVPIPACELGAANLEVVHAEAVQEVEEPKKRLSFLEHIGNIFLDDILPIALQIGVPILERKI